MVKASTRKSEKQIPASPFDIPISTIHQNWRNILLFKSVTLPPNSHKAQTSDLQTSPSSAATGRVVYGSASLRLMGNAVRGGQRRCWAIISNIWQTHFRLKMTQFSSLSQLNWVKNNYKRLQKHGRNIGIQIVKEVIYIILRDVCL